MSFDWKDGFTMDPVYDAGTYEAPSWTVGDDFFKFDPKETGGIDWSTIYANQDVLKGLGDSYEDPFSKGIDFLKDFTSEEKSQYFDAQKAASGLPTNKPSMSAYNIPGTNVTLTQAGMSTGGFLGGPLPALASTASGAFRPAGGGALGIKNIAQLGANFAQSKLTDMALAAIPGVGPALAIANKVYPGGLPEAFKDVTRFAGGIGNTIAKGVGGIFDGVGDFVGNLLCDERLKVDIAPLESTEVNDELAQMAFFVKGIRECS